MHFNISAKTLVKDSPKKIKNKLGVYVCVIPLLIPRFTYLCSI